MHVLLCTRLDTGTVIDQPCVHWGLAELLVVYFVKGFQCLPYTYRIIENRALPVSPVLNSSGLFLSSACASENSTPLRSFKRITAGKQNLLRVLTKSQLVSGLEHESSHWTEVIFGLPTHNFPSLLCAPLISIKLEIMKRPRRNTSNQIHILYNKALAWQAFHQGLDEVSFPAVILRNGALNKIYVLIFHKHKIKTTLIPPAGQQN